MRARTRTLLAWSLWLATFGCLLGGLVVTLFLTRPLTADVLLTGAFNGACWLLFATIGLVLTLRRPENPIGWLYAAGGLVWSAYVPLIPGSTHSRPRTGPCPLVPGWPPWSATASGRSASPWPSPCPCCCCPTGGCGHPAGGSSWSPPWPVRP